MCVMNTSDKEKNIDFKNYEERTKGFTKAIDIVSNTTFNNSFTVPAKTMWVLELKK